MPRQDLIRIRNDTYTNWTTTDPVIAEGEPVWDKTNKVLKIGNGASTYNQLNGINGNAYNSVIGVEWDTQSASPDLKRIDMYGNKLSSIYFNWQAYFDMHPIFGNIRRCILDAAGTPTYGTNPRGDGLTTTSDYVMVEIPQFYVKEEYTADYKKRWWISPYALDGFIVHPWFNQRGGSLSQPCKFGHVGAYKASGTSSLLTSKSGVAPLGNITMAAFETAGNAIGANWGITNAHYQSLLQLLMYTEFASLNIQSALAPGFTKSTNTAPQTCGASDSLMGTNGTGGGTDVQGVNYRGINNPYGDLWEFRIGWNSVDAEYRVLKADGTGTIADTLASGSYDATSGITPLNGTTNISGTDAGNHCHGYAKSVLNVDPLKLFFIPESLTGSETTYLCDYFYSHILGQTGCLVAGGYWRHAGDAGPGYLNAFNAVSFVHSSAGARVEFLGVTS